MSPPKSNEIGLRLLYQGMLAEFRILTSNVQRQYPVSARTIEFQKTSASKLRMERFLMAMLHSNVDFGP